MISEATEKIGKTFRNSEVDVLGKWEENQIVEIYKQKIENLRFHVSHLVQWCLSLLCSGGYNLSKQDDQVVDSMKVRTKRI